MTIKPLSQTNPYLKDAVMREWLISRSVRTSCGVEGIRAPKGAYITIPKVKDKKWR
jgi:hypothetical protein